jgi:DNA-binding MarR family transcriptional regulator
MAGSGSRDLARRRAQQALDDPIAASIATSWRELRRGASMQQVRSVLYDGLPVELDIGQADTLGLLVADGRARMRDLADALRVDRSTATRAADRLVTVGLARRTTTTEDGRGVVLEPTPEGRAVYDELITRYRRFLLEVLEGFDPEERALLAGLLARFVDRIDDVLAPGPTSEG